MATLDKQARPEVEIRHVRFEGDLLLLELSYERQIGLTYKKVKWLDWLAAAPPEQRAQWQIEPHGYAVWWKQLDDGLELVHALSLHPLPHKKAQQVVEPAFAAA